jgi:hypothetical protein
VKSQEWIVGKATTEDIDAMLSLNYAIYPKEWHVTRSYVEQIMQKNSQVYNVLRTCDGIKGIFSIFPLPKVIYEQILHGTLTEAELAQCILPYDHPKRVCLYFISLIVDIHDPLRKLHAKSIIQAIPEELRRLEKQGITVDEIGAIAITKDGNRILKRIGFTISDQVDCFDQKFNVYRADLDDIYNAITTH